MESTVNPGPASSSEGRRAGARAGAGADEESTATRLPPGPSAPRLVQGVTALVRQRRGLHHLRARYGDAFVVDWPVVGPSLVISTSSEIKQLYTAGDAVENLENHLGVMFGPDSLVVLNGDEHRVKRKLLSPPFHGRRLAAYDEIVRDETMRELATWPTDREFPVLPSMGRITLNVILRSIFGAEDAEVAELRRRMPRGIKTGAFLTVAPLPGLGGPCSLRARYQAFRRAFDAIVDRLIDKAERDRDLDRRDDVLALMVQARYDDGARMSRSEISDNVLSLVAAGHETVAVSLAWAVERLRRHPHVLDALVEEADAGGEELRKATILEVQRTRPVIDVVARRVRAERLTLGRWTVPEGHMVLVGSALIHDDESVFPNATVFDPSRFVAAKPDQYEWVPFGGGSRRCVGAAFAEMEMNVVLCTMLRAVTLLPTNARDERFHFNGVTNGPARGGRAAIRHRNRED